MYQLSLEKLNRYYNDARPDIQAQGDGLADFNRGLYLQPPVDGVGFVLGSDTKELVFKDYGDHRITCTLRPINRSQGELMIRKERFFAVGEEVQSDVFEKEFKVKLEEFRADRRSVEREYNKRLNRDSVQRNYKDSIL